MESASLDRSPSDDYFNDLSQQPAKQTPEQRGALEDNSQIPKTKRIACVLCRKRKLRCGGEKPSCATCTRLQHDCSYDEVRRKSGPKRGYVKALEARLAQVEVLLTTQDDQPPAKRKPEAVKRKATEARPIDVDPDYTVVGEGVSTNSRDFLGCMEQSISQQELPIQEQFPYAALGLAGSGDVGMPSEEAFPWEMIGLGLDEPLPSQEVINELNQTYFEKIHPSLPMIHRPRYLAAMNLAPHMRPPVCLRYAMWCNAAGLLDKYEGLQEHFYQRSRKYIQQDEMKGHGESMITLAHCQTWSLLASYEFKRMFFPHAWMSSGRASRMALMMGLHRLDGISLDVKQCLPPPRDWTEREERRRTFWAAFCVDRYSSIGTGWPMVIEEKDILSSLPPDEQSYELGIPGKAMSLGDALSPTGAPNLSGFGGVILMACLFGRNLTHLHRPSPTDEDSDLNGEFWKRHRDLDNILLNISLSLPQQLRLPSGSSDANVVFLNMNIHTSTICLHQAAIFKADKNQMPARISAESKVRCISAAAEIATIMRQICHMDLSAMNPFISFCLYVAARVFVQYLKARKADSQIRSSLQFLLSAMHAIKRKNPLTESFLVQLDVDLEGAGLESSSTLRATPGSPQVANRAPACPDPLITKPPADLCAPTYGDQGLAMYNEPNNNISDTQTGTQYSTTFGYVSKGTTFFPKASDGSPTSWDRVGTDASPNSDGRTPSSATQSLKQTSSHTSTTAYSPQNQQSDTAQSTGGLGTFNIADRTAPIDIDMQDYLASAPANQSGFVFSLPRDGTGFGLGSMPTGFDQGPPNGFNATGFTPGPSGFTPGPTGMTPGAFDMANMSEEEFTKFMGEFSAGSWETGAPYDASKNGPNPWQGTAGT